MKKSKLKYVLAIAAIVAAALAFSRIRVEREEAGMSLPIAEKSGGMPLFEALSKRHSSREFGAKEVPAQVLSNLLWAANGLRADGEHRTAPTAMNRQEIELYVIDRSGAYFFDHRAHSLQKIDGGDLTAGASNYGAPLAIAIVADSSKSASREMAYADAGFVAQNIYLAATSLGLSSVLMASTFDRELIVKKLGLEKGQKLLFMHAIGYPAE
jgi:nitroreductase